MAKNYKPKDLLELNPTYAHNVKFNPEAKWLFTAGYYESLIKEICERFPEAQEYLNSRVISAKDRLKQDIGIEF